MGEGVKEFFVKYVKRLAIEMIFYWYGKKSGRLNRIQIKISKGVLLKMLYVSIALAL